MTDHVDGFSIELGACNGEWFCRRCKWRMNYLEHEPCAICGPRNDIARPLDNPGIGCPAYEPTDTAPKCSSCRYWLSEDAGRCTYIAKDGVFAAADDEFVCEHYEPKATPGQYLPEATGNTRPISAFSKPLNFNLTAAPARSCNNCSHRQDMVYVRDTIGEEVRRPCGDDRRVCKRYKRGDPP